MSLLGVRTLEGFGVMVDNISHRFVAITTLVANVSNGPPVFLDSHFCGNDVIPAKAGIHFAGKLVDGYLNAYK
ncbi:MAG: hypothetical protein HQK78_00155 [Desulfobacterales bacterium]|nr:hypothetical protein [Desulfobacterales bacterium]